MSDTLRVVTVTTSFPRWEGDFAGHFVASLAEELVRRGHSISVVAPHASGSPAVEDRNGVRIVRPRYLPGDLESLAYGNGILPNLRTHPSRAFEIPALSLSLRSGVRREIARGADLVHVHWGPTAQLCGARTLHLPLVLSLHGTEVSRAEEGGVWEWLLRRSVRPADAVNVMADSQERIVRQHTSFEGPVEIAPAGVPEALITRPRPARRTGQVVIAYVGRLVPEKGIEDLAGVFARMAVTMPDLRLVIAGAGPSETEVRRIAEEGGVASQVELLGEVSHEKALDTIAEADLLALPSYGEGSPLSVTEALALGTPVVASDVGALPDLVGDGGVVVPKGDLGALEAALMRLATDAGMRIAMGARARERMARTRAWPVIASRVETLYRTAIERRADRGRR